MAVDLKKTFYGWTDTELIASGELVTVEGQGLIAILEDNVEKVKPSAGGAGEKFAGFARFRQLVFGIGANVEDAVVPAAAPLTVELAKNNLIVGQVRVIVVATGVAFNPVVAPAVPAPGDVLIDHASGLLTFNVADAAKPIKITYRWNKTVLEAKTTDYEAPANYPDPNMAGQVGVGKGKSRLFTLHYDASKLYDATSALTLGAAGVVTVGGIGPAIPNSRVVQVPTSADPYLGIEFLA